MRSSSAYCCCCCCIFRGGDSKAICSFIFFSSSISIASRCHSKWLSHSQYLFNSFFVGYACILSSFFLALSHFSSLIFLVRCNRSERDRSFLRVQKKSNLNTCASSERNWNPQRVQLLKIQPKTTWRKKNTLKEWTHKSKDNEHFQGNNNNNNDQIWLQHWEKDDAEREMKKQRKKNP